MRNVVLALPAFLILLCLAMMAIETEGYVRHSATGDQAGFALGLFMLVSYLIPLAAATLVGTMGWRARRTRAGKPPRPSVAWTGLFGLSGIGVLLFLLANVVWNAQQTRETFALGHWDGWGWVMVGSSLGVLATFAGLLLAVALQTRRPDSAMAERLLHDNAWGLMALLLLYVIESIWLSYRYAFEPNVGGDPLTYARGMLLSHTPTLLFLAILFGMLWTMPKSSPTLEGASGDPVATS